MAAQDINLLKLQWIQNKGAPYNAYTDLDFALREYIKSKSTLVNVALNDHFRKVMTTLGFTSGDLEADLRAFFVSKTGLSNTLSFNQLEAAFYGNNAFDFI
jgi:hypothetical protein